MISRVITAAAASIAVFSAATLTTSIPALALTMKECSAKYQSAKTSGDPSGKLKWNDFRKAQCGPDATAEPEATLNANEDTEPAAPTAKAPSGVSFPRTVSSKYSSESPGKARMHTCVDAYHEAKANNALGGLKWIQKGGGYYSLCNARLKG